MLWNGEDNPTSPHRIVSLTVLQIFRSSIKLSGDMLALDKKLIATATGPITGHTQLHLSEVDSQYLVTFADGHIFGHVNARMEKALTDMKEQQLQLEFEVFVPTRSTRETLGRATKGQEAVIRAQMNVYGPRISAHSAGQELSQNKFYLQLPDYIRDGTVYENPHMLVFAEDSNAVPTTNVTSEEPNDGTTTDEHFQEVVANVYSSLTRNENLTGLEGHQRLRRPLLKYVVASPSFLAIVAHLI